MVSWLYMTYSARHTRQRCRIPLDNIASQKIVQKSRKIDEQSRNITSSKVRNDTKKSRTISNVPIDSRKECRCITAGLLAYLLTYLLTYKQNITSACLLTALTFGQILLFRFVNQSSVLMNWKNMNS